MTPARRRTWLAVALALPAFLLALDAAHGQRGGPRIGGPGIGGPGMPNPRPNPGIGGPNNGIVGGPNNNLAGGPNNNIVGGPNNNIVGGPNNLAGGPDNNIAGGPNVGQPQVPQPVWVTVWSCSRCNRELGRGDIPPNITVCPHCGARLTGGIGSRREEAPSRTDPKKGEAVGSFLLIVGAITGVALLLGGGGVLIAWLCQKPSRPKRRPRIPDDAAERYNRDDADWRAPAPRPRRPRAGDDHVARD